jgi:hypothetical protein
VAQLPQKRWRGSRVWPQTGQIDTGGVYRRVLRQAFATIGQLTAVTFDKGPGTTPGLRFCWG